MKNSIFLWVQRSLGGSEIRFIYVFKWIKEGGLAFQSVVCVLPASASHGSLIEIYNLRLHPGLPHQNLHFQENFWWFLHALTFEKYWAIDSVKFTKNLWFPQMVRTHCSRVMVADLITFLSTEFRSKTIKWNLPDIFWVPIICKICWEVQVQFSSVA